MNTIELQNSLIRKILNINDNQMLDYLNSILTKSDDPDIYKLSDFEKQVINESVADYRNKKTISNNNVFTKTDKWLEE